MICGWRASMSPSRGAAPRIKRHQRDQVAVLPQQRNQPAAALQGAEEAIERGHGVIGVFGMREAVDQAGHEFDEGGLGRFVAERAIIALHPELQRAGHRDRLLEAERRQMVEQARILGPGGVVDLRQLAPCRSDRPRTACRNAPARC